MKLAMRYKWVSFLIIIVILICTCPLYTQANTLTTQEDHSCSSNTHTDSNDSTTRCEKCPNKGDKISDVNQSYIFCIKSTNFMPLVTSKRYENVNLAQSFNIERSPPLNKIKLNC